jgi:asparagine synthase (glutamine-hydrolysing)
MCGITVAIPIKKLSPTYIVKMNNQIIHRGSDDGGFVFFNDGNAHVCGVDETNYQCDTEFTPKYNISEVNNIQDVFDVAFAHRRLSIVDLSPLGHQPMSRDGLWITYNGEIYNYIEIRKDLINLGHKFISESDTEVILAAYQEWGYDCLNKFNGMFAFVIYDTVKNVIFAARDRFGVKPLYCYQDDTGIYFASEIKQFTVLPNWRAKLNHQRAHDFLVFGLTDHTNETLFDGVKQLRGGEYTIIEVDKIQDYRESGIAVNKWYLLSMVPSKVSYQNASNEFEQLFKKSIKLRLRSDVEIGSCLSGGLDSSAIVCAMAEELAKQDKRDLLKTFSACSYHKEFDESEYIDVVNKYTKAQGFNCYPELNKLFEQLEDITWHQDEPFGSTSIYAQWSVFELAKNNKVKVILDGQGADEQLAGYHGLYFQILLNQLLSQGKIIQYIRELYDLKKHHNFHVCNGILKSALGVLPTVIKPLVGKLLGKNKYKTNWINYDILVAKNEDQFMKTGLNPKNITDTLYSQIIYSNLPMLLHWEDRDSMAHSIESRVPFLDYNLVEYLISLPSNYKIKNGVTKKILRDGLKSLLPNVISNRMSKLGFVTPEEIWVKDNPEYFRDKLIEAIKNSKGILDEKKYNKYF